jgi:cell division septation protein DedD
VGRINDDSPITTAWRTQNAACERLVEAAAELNTRPTTVGRAPAISAAEVRWVRVFAAAAMLRPPISAQQMLSPRLALVTRQCPDALIRQEREVPMRSREFSKARWADEQYVDDLDLDARPRKRASFALTRFLIGFCGGVAATLAWQSHGGAARKMLASWSPQLRWSAPQASPEAATRASWSPQLGRSAPQAAPEASGWSAPQAAPEASGRSAPQAAPEAATRTMDVGGFGFVVQLSAHRSEPGAQAAFRTMQAKYSVLSGRQPLIRRKDQGERGIFYAAQVGPFDMKSDADQLCETLRSAGGTCFVGKN